MVFNLVYITLRYLTVDTYINNKMFQNICLVLFTYQRRRLPMAKSGLLLKVLDTKNNRHYMSPW